MKINKYILMSLAAASLCLSSCKDDFAEMNTDTSQVDLAKGDPTYIFAQGVLEFEPQGYLYWFYNATDIYQWTQMGVATGGVTSSLADGASSQEIMSIKLLKYVNDMADKRSKMAKEKSDQYQMYSAALDVLAVYMGIYDSDFIGNIPYTEGGQAIHGGTMTPKYDKVEELYALWLTTLDNAAVTFKTAQSQIFVSSQDVVYNGDASRWAKLANSLKLKIAARLISQNKTKALAVAKEVANSSAGVLDGAADDFMFNKAIGSTSDDDYTYHWDNQVLQSVGGSEAIINFLKENRDPRLRFIFEKNEWNSKIVQEFFNRKLQNQIPPFIMENIDYEVGADGIYKFKAWKGVGEPWVRYYGIPMEYEAANNTSKYGAWFSYLNDGYSKLSGTSSNKTYIPYSMFQREQTQGRVKFTVPTIPDVSAIEDKSPTPWWGMYMTTAEVNLYLAEFALLGADLPQTASIYFDKAVRASVEEQDRLSGKNRVPYYGTTYNYDPNEVSIELKAGEIETMMANSAYKLTGDRATDLEKVYIQQIIHFSAQLPIELYVTGRRSGVPVIGSKILNRVDYSQVPVTTFPRRMALTQPSPTDLMYDILISSYEEQGFTVGVGGILNSQRLWQDKAAPQWGAGPQY